MLKVEVSKFYREYRIHKFIGANNFYYFYIKFEVTNIQFFQLSRFFKHPTFTFITQGLSRYSIALHESFGRKMGKYNGRFVHHRDPLSKI